MKILLRFVMLLAALLPLGAAAQAFPTKPVRIVVMTGAGSGIDLLVRALVGEMSRALGQTVVVENLPGAVGLIATRQVARSTPDGYTLLATHSAALPPLLGSDVDFDVQKSLAPVSLMVESELYLVTNSDAPWNTLDEMIAYGKANPTKLNLGAVGPSDLFTLLMSIIRQKRGFAIEDIYYKDGAIGYTRGLRTKEVHAIMGTRTTALAGYKGNYGKALAVSGTRRMPALPDLPMLPDIPTFAELGFPEITGIAFMLFSAAGTPKPVIERLNQAVVQTLRDPEVATRVNRLGFQVVGSSPEALGQTFGEQITRLRGMMPKQK